MGKYIKGLSKDTAHIDQPEGTWRYARNIQIHPVDGALSNEHAFKALTVPVKPGEDAESVLPVGAVVIGTIEITDDRIILFLAFRRNEQGILNADQNVAFNTFATDYNSEIGLLENDSYTTLFRPNISTVNVSVAITGTNFNLNFSRDNFIEGTYKINPEGELFIYWVDNLNPPRAMNVTRQKEWIDNPEGASAPFERLYGLDPETTSNPHHIRMLDLFPSSGPVPHVEFDSINPGGNLQTGVYFLALAYVDRDLVSTNYVTLANPVSIVEDVEGVLPIERYDGAPAGVPSGKSISWAVSNLNTDYEYLRPVVIRRADGKRTTFKLNDLPIKNTAGTVELQTVTFTGLEGFAGFDSVEDVIVDTASYETAKTINQLDGSLYLGNVKGTKDVGYQPYANFIKSRPALHPFPYFDPHEATLDVLEHGYIDTFPNNLQAGDIESRSQGYRHNKNIYKYKGFTRDEVYAFYIAFILEDGTESYAYHIPGRAPLRLDESVGGDFQYNRVPTYQYNTDIFDINFTFESDDIYPSNPENALNQITNQKGRIFHFFETSMLLGSRNMNYWQNTNEFYPSDELNASNWEILDASNPDRREGSIAGRRVRHHHFPSNENPTYQTIVDNTSTIDVVLEVKEVYAIDFRWCSDRVARPAIGFGTTALDNNETIFGKLLGIYQGNDDPSNNDMNNDNLVEVATILGLQTGLYSDSTNPDGEDAKIHNVMGNVDNKNQLFMFYELNDNSYEFPQMGDKISMAWQNHGARDGGKIGSYASQNSTDSGDSPYASNGFLMDGSAGLEGNTLNTYGTDEYLFKSSRPSSNDGIANPGDCRDKGGTVHLSTGCIEKKGKGVWTWDTHSGAMGDSVDDDNIEQDGGWGTADFQNAISSSKLTVVFVDKAKGVIIAKANKKGAEGSTAINASGLFPFRAADCRGWVHWKSQDTSAVDGGSIGHYVRALGIQFEDLKVPLHIHERTQGFRIYYADRDHHERRILGQNIVNPYATVDEAMRPSCENSGGGDVTETISDSSYSLDSVFENNKNFYWLNYPHQVEKEGYPLPNPTDAGMEFGYQGISFHDFYLMRGHGQGDSGGARRSITAATHLKLDYIVEMIAFSGPSIRQESGSETCYSSSNQVITGLHTAFNFYSPSEAQDPALGIFNGGTGTENLYQWLSSQGTHVDLNRPIKERSKTYLNGDSIFNGKQLGFGRRTWNNYGESHISLLLNEKYGTLPAFDLPGTLPWIKTDPPADAMFEAQIGKSGFQPFMYQANMHAFRLDMYSPFDQQDLVWTGYEVTGKDYDFFKVDRVGNPRITVETDNLSTMSFQAAIDNGLHPTFAVQGPNPVVLNRQTNPPIIDGVYPDGWPNYNAMSIDDYIKVAAQPALDNFRTGHIFGGDTFICRHGYRKTLRSNFHIDEFPADPGRFDSTRRKDCRVIYNTIVESTDNINFRHVNSKKDSYFPGTPARDLLILKNTVDGTDVDNMKYNEDYSVVNSIGSTVPLPRQISQPSSFPTRVIRSATSDDSSLIDNYRLFLALQFKDLPKNRGELWKIATFNNLLYFHMEDSILRTKGKQTMELGDASQAFIGSGDLFAQPPEEIRQTEAGYGGTQSQFATLVGDFGYFYVDQRNASVHLFSDQLYDISSMGLEKWFQTNLPYKLKVFGKVNYPDNPITFGFTSAYDEVYQRILLTKRELVPNSLFLQAWQNFIDQNVADPVGMITYSPSNSNLYGVENAEDQFLIKLPDVTTDDNGNLLTTDEIEEVPWQILPVSDDPYMGTKLSPGNKETYFQRDGWTASYSPKLSAWISFHDYVPYQYTYTSNALYSFNNFSHFTSRLNIGDRIYKHNYVGQKGWYYGRRYTSELEIIHNQNKFTNKLFYNFCWISDRISQAIDSEIDYGGCPLCGVMGGSDNRIPDMDQQDNLLLTKTHGPGFDRFVVYNSHQSSGLQNITEMLNARKNGCEWCINKFRDFTNHSAVNNLTIPDLDNLYMLSFLPIPNSSQVGEVAVNTDGVEVETEINAVMINGQQSLTSIPPNQLPLFIVSDMHETFNGSSLASKVTDGRFRPRKMIDKWLAIRLITSNINSFLVNLYSTEVGARKFHRHEKRQN